eukprot:357723-Chlamydomonas_euryale.AAC.12
MTDTSIVCVCACMLHSGVGQVGDMVGMRRTGQRYGLEAMRVVDELIRCDKARQGECVACRLCVW